MKTKYTEKLVCLVKATGQDIIDRAEDIVGDGELISDFTIRIRFPQNTGIPEIEVNKTFLSRETLNLRRYFRGEVSE